MADEATAPLALREIVKDASMLAEKRKELDRLRSDHARQWAENREFYRNNQWVFWNDKSGQIESYPEASRYKVRLTVNEVTPGVNKLVAQLTKTRPVIRAIPASGSDRDVKSAEMAERLYEFWWNEFSLKSKLISALTNAQISQGYWLITWDGLAGKSMKFMLNPETGAPISDEQLADVFREQLDEQAQEMGLDPMALRELFEKTVYVGDIRVQVLDGTQVWLDPVARSFEDAKYAFIKVPMDVDDIEARYKKRVTPDASPGDARPQLMYTRGNPDERPKTVRDTYHLYVPPSAIMPKGRYVCFIEGPNEILYESDWEAPFSELPLVKFPGIESESSVYDIARTTLVRPIQKELNRTISQTMEHKNLTLKPQLLAPVGSLRQRLTSEPGAVFEYAPIANHIPQWREIPNIPSYVFEQIRDLRTQIARYYNEMPTERSQLPARTDSGHLVDLVQEAVADQISTEIQRMEEALARAGGIMAQLAQKFYTENRQLKIIGAGGSVQVKKFRNADLAGGFSFSPEAGSGLPRTRAGQVQQLREMIEMQVLTPMEALPYLPIAGLKTIQARLKSDEEYAHRKIEKLIKGEPLNVPAMIEAIQVVQSGMNPMTEEMFQSPEEAQAFVQQAAMSPMPFENVPTTLFVLGQHMKGSEFEAYPPEIQQLFTQHFSMLQQMMASQGPNGEPIKTTLSLKGTVGPTVAAEILQQGGIRGATPETLAEPPLETSVYDSMDKPDADEAGNDPFTEQEQALLQEREEEAHQLKTAKAMHELSQAQREAVAAEEDREIRHSREDEIHQERVRKMREPKTQERA